ncbi:hypothetical protein SporoP37_02080 [Sporosarcina sp. P37]|uniref:hypothetical protein n=1 Tax=unclassified Sporosarcina TaxID=2647733 RepID=UPI000A17C5CA|nr:MULTISPECIES: hypothetical protein [unclassified Sporosarcina]ARK23596.1 hypothetical protein SporoP37_02080 [Sporosarcina sp. P37]PID18780.1 hypothetical protein CSV62_06670 [Sporosarcina sp. P35]
MDNYLDRLQAACVVPKEPVTVDECTYCGQELSEGERVLAFPSEYNYFCNVECATEQMLKEGNIEWRVLE